MFDPALNALLQTFSRPVLDGFFIAVTAAGYGVVLAVILSALYWTWDRRRAFVLIQFILYSGLINHALKEWFQMPRPFQVAPDAVRVLDPVMRLEICEGGIAWAVPAKTSYGFPSGHAQIAVCLWGALALHWRRRGATIAATALVLLIAFSRLYLGVHFLGDVLGGLAVGGLLLAAYAMAREVESHGDRSPSGPFLILLGGLLPLVFLVSAPDVSTARRVGLLLGVTVGFMFDRLAAKESAVIRRSPVQRAACAALGVLVIGGLGYLLREVRQRFDADHQAFDPIVFALTSCLLVGFAVPVWRVGFHAFVALAADRKPPRAGRPLRRAVHSDSASE